MTMENQTIYNEWPSVSRTTLAALTLVATQDRKLQVPQQQFDSRSRIETILADAGFKIMDTNVDPDELIDAANATQEAAWTDEQMTANYFAGPYSEVDTYGPQSITGDDRHVMQGAVARTVNTLRTSL